MNEIRTKATYLFHDKNGMRETTIIPIGTKMLVTAEFKEGNKVFCQFTIDGVYEEDWFDVLFIINFCDILC